MTLIDAPTSIQAEQSTAHQHISSTAEDEEARIKREFETDNDDMAFDQQGTPYPTASPKKLIKTEESGGIAPGNPSVNISDKPTRKWILDDEDDDDEFAGNDDHAIMAAMDLDQASECLSIIPHVSTPKDSNVQDDLHSIQQEGFPILLKMFYQYLFPHKEFYTWLNFGKIARSNAFAHREFSFTLPNDAYIRFQSFTTPEELRAELIRMVPIKIDIGAVYNIKPKDRKTISASAFQPLARELIFDIDMTDYDPVRTCCSGADICRKCWTFMTVSIKVLDRALRSDFGFKHLLWVYSGRRGVHCWVCDDTARLLTPEARRAIVSYLEVIKGGENVTKKVNLKYPLHPSLSKAYKVLEPHFRKTILDEMASLQSPELWGKFLALLSDEEVKAVLSKEWAANPSLSSSKKWDMLCAELASRKRPANAHTAQEMVFQYMYPRLDVNVSIGLNHLLKAPFCVHPKTGRVCVPIDPANCEKFDPFDDVPLLSDLIAELNGPNGGALASGNGKDYERTSLHPYISQFKAFLKGLTQSTLQAERERSKGDMTF